MATEGPDEGELVGWITQWPTLPLLGWSSRRFLVLEHGTVVVYDGEEAWQSHQQPALVLNLTFDSTVERGRRFGQPSLHVTTPEGSLVFSPEAEDGEEHAAAELWLMYLEQWLALLKRERAPGSEPHAQAEAELDERLHRLSNAAAGAAAASAAGGGPGGAEVHFGEEAKDGGSGVGDVETALKAIDKEKDGDDDDDDDDEDEDASPAPRQRGRFWGRVRRRDGGSGGVSSTGHGASNWRRSPLGVGSPTTEQPGGVFGRTWLLLRGRKPSCRECRCVWCREETRAAGGSLHAHNHGFFKRMRQSHAHRGIGASSGNLSGLTGVSGASGAFVKRGFGDAEARKAALRLRRRRRALPKSRRLSTAEMGDVEEDDEYAYQVASMWEEMVIRFLGLQAARGGDIDVVKSVLQRYPDHPDKNNMFRAAVRFKHYDMVDYFLDVQKMDVNLVNVAGMTVSWFAIMHFSKNDGGVMLRYLQSRGGDIKKPNKWGQTVIHFVATSDPKVAIPGLRYLSEQHGLDLHHKDMFGSLPLHWATLFGHLETVKWLSDVTCYVMGRANWAWMFREMQGLQIIRPEHLGAVRQWRALGLDKFATAVTPLGVAVLHNHEEIAKWLMGHDPKGEPKHVQAKRRALFADNCRDLALVSRTWPELLPDVLDGFCTEMRGNAAASDARRGGWREKRYDIRLLFGRPDAKPGQTPLAILLDTGYAPLFQLRIMQLVVALKWQIFGQAYYLYELSRYLALCFCFLVGFIAYPNVNSEAGAVARVLCWLLTLYNLLIEEGREMWASPSLREYFWSGWNVQSLSSYLLLLSLLPLYVAQWESGNAFGFGEGAGFGDPGTIKDATRMIVAPAALLLFLRFMEHLAVWRTTSVLIAVVRMMFRDTLKWSILFLLFQGAFDVAFFGLLRGEMGYTSMGQTIITVFAMSMGQIETSFSEDPALNAMAALMVIAFTLLVSVLYVNLLVAMMTTSYEQVLKAASAQALMNRVETLLKWEGIMHTREREKAFRRIAPGKGRRAHITLKSSVEGAATEVFIYEDDIQVVEPAPMVREDNFTRLWARLDSLAAQITQLGDAVKRSNLSSGGSSSSSGVVAGRAFARRVGLSGLGGLGTSGRGGGSGGSGGATSTAAGAFRDAARRAVSARASAEEVDLWRKRAEDIAARQKSRKAIVKAQAVIRGHLERKKLRAIYETPALPDDEPRSGSGGGNDKDRDGDGGNEGGSRWRPRWR